MSQATRQRLVTNDSIVCAELDNEMVLLNVETGIYYGLNPVGTEIWNLLSQGIDDDRIVETLLDAYEIDREQMERDVAALIDSLVKAGLVHQRDMPSPAA